MVAFFLPPAFGRYRIRCNDVGTAGTFTSDPTTLTSVNFGPAIRKRVWVVVSWVSENNRTLDEVEIGGVVAERAGRANDSAVSSNVDIWHAVTSATSGNVYLNWSAGLQAGIAYVFWSDPALVGVGTPAQFSNVNSGTDISVTVDTFSHGYLLVAARWSNSRTFSLTGVDATPLETGFETFGFIKTTNQQTARPITGTLSSASGFRRMVAVPVR